jgi:hypothetical protein
MLTQGSGSCVLDDLSSPGQRTITAEYQGDDVFASSSGTATHTVNDPGPQNSAPDAVNDGYSTPQGTPLTVPAQGPLLIANDSDPDSDDLFVDEVTAAATTQGGQVTIGDDGSFTYTPPSPAFTGQDTFTYTLRDRPPGQGGLSDVATVTITVN